MRYLFHNVYGDADALITNKPDDVTCVPFGWDEQTEAIRNSFLALLNIGISSLPAVVAWREERIVTSEDPNDTPKTIPAGWDAIYLLNIDKANWNWQHIQSLIDNWNN